MGIIDEILRNKQEELAWTKTRTQLSQIKALIEDAPARRSASFKDKLKRKQGESIWLIAEIKKASPSKGVIRQDVNIEDTARVYEEKGAGAISVLTEKRYFGGALDDLKTVSKCTTVPLLR